MFSGIAKLTHFHDLDLTLSSPEDPFTHAKLEFKLNLSLDCTFLSSETSDLFKVVAKQHLDRLAKESAGKEVIENFSFKYQVLSSETTLIAMDKAERASADSEELEPVTIVMKKKEVP